MQDIRADALFIQGGRPLRGSIRVQGSKNGSLPVMSAAYLCGGRTALTHCPAITDVTCACEILRSLGCRVAHGDGTVSVDAEGAAGCRIPDDLMGRMRSSVIFLGSMLARTGCAELSQPGGCPLGPRPIGMHLDALRALGAEITESGNTVRCTARRLTGARVVLPFPSVGATENLLLAAATAQGETRLLCAACEPEIVELAHFLNACGAQIEGAGSPEIGIQGVNGLQGVRWRLESDRIAALTWLAAAAVTGGEVTVEDVPVEQLRSVLRVFALAGCRLTADERSVTLQAPDRLSPLGKLQTLPYPGFPTDAQAICMTMAALADGTSVFVENLFSERYHHCEGLCRMGAKIQRIDRVAVVEGVRSLKPARVCAADLRGAAALMLAAAAAEGSSVLTGIPHLERGYEHTDRILNRLGGCARLVKEPSGQ